MALVAFRSKAAGEIFMFAETARRILEILGRADAPRGVITAAQVAAALDLLQKAVDQEKAASKGSTQDDDAQGDETKARPISLGQRAYPLLEMLRIAAKKQVDVTWGV